MPSRDMLRNRRAYIDAINVYFAALDGFDVEATIGCFADDASLTCETNKMHLEGHDEIREFFIRITRNSHEMRHEVTNVIVDLESRSCAAELSYINRRITGGLIDTSVVDIFDFDGEGKFTRVRFWTSDVIVRS